MGSEKSFYFLFLILLFSKGLKGHNEPRCCACNAEENYDVTELRNKLIEKNSEITKLTEIISITHNIVQEMNQTITEIFSLTTHSKEKWDIEILKQFQRIETSYYQKITTSWSIEHFYIEEQNEGEVVENNNDENPKPKEKTTLRFDANHNCIEGCTDKSNLWNGCDTALQATNNKNKIYALNPPETNLPPFGAYCMFDEGKAWTIIQRRQDGSENFTRNWEDYKNGFGNLHGEYWLGLERLHALTSKGKYELWVKMITRKGETITVHYGDFSVGSESDKYKLSISSLKEKNQDQLDRNNGMKFTTYDSKNDLHPTFNCAEHWAGAWWYRMCGHSNLNGEYKPHYKDKQTGGDKGLWWSWDKKKSLIYVHLAMRAV